MKELKPLGDYELFLFVSPEERCLFGLSAAEQIGSVTRLWVVEFEDYGANQPDDLSSLDNLVVQKYWQNQGIIDRWSGAHTRETKQLGFRLNLLEPFDVHLGPPCPFKLPLVIDISCAPRGHLLALLDYLVRCQEQTNQHVVLMYSLVERQATNEEAFSYGIQDIAVVPGYNGRISLKQDLLILILGFEGNRAYSLYRRLTPNKTLLILGDSGDQDKAFYLQQAQANNHGLLHIHGNKQYLMPSRDPLAFQREFSKFLEKEVSPIASRYNVYLSCLGTKAQTVGTFLALRSHPYIQVVDSLPTRRRIASEGKRDTLFADLSSSGLVMNSNTMVHRE